MIKSKGETPCIHSPSQRPQSKHHSEISVNNLKSPLFAASIASTKGKSLGQFLWQFPHVIHFLAISIAPSLSGIDFFPFLIGFTLIATSTATFPAFSGSRMSTPNTFPETRSSIISSAGSAVLSGKPSILLSLVAI